MSPIKIHSIQHPIIHSKEPLSQLPPSHLSIHLLLLRPKPILLLVPPSCATFAPMRGGHFTCNCTTVHEYLNVGKFSQGSNGRLYMADRSSILCTPGGWCLRDGVDYALASQQSTPQPTTAPATTSTSASSGSGFTRDILYPPTSQSVFCVLHTLTPLLFWISIHQFLWQQWHWPQTMHLCLSLWMWNFSHMLSRLGHIFKQIECQRRSVRSESASMALRCYLTSTLIWIHVALL